MYQAALSAEDVGGSALNTFVDWCVCCSASQWVTMSYVYLYMYICIYVYMCYMYICICTRLALPQKTLKGVPPIRSWIGDMVRVLLAFVSPPMGCEMTITSVLQCVAVCCSGLRCVAVCCSMLQSVAVCCSELQCVAVRSSVLPRVAECYSVMRCDVFFPLHKNWSIFALQKKLHPGAYESIIYLDMNMYWMYENKKKSYAGAMR